MSNDSEPTPPDNNRIPADMDATILPGASGVSNSKLPSKAPADIDATILPGARGHDSDATIIPGARDAPSDAGQQAAPVQSFAPRLERIGDCKVEKRLGVGGFGEVWLATQESDLLKRRVAIKLLKAGMDSASVLERFELERKVLSTLNHPSISRLYGGGVTEDGRSYFIMEFVEGLTLGLWCKRQKLTVTERLAIFRQVCSAVAHAHAVGIVHRDLKPDNIMVTAEGVPKLLDFGIAKIVNRDVKEEDRAQDMPGEVGPLTPMYASPEQWRGEPLTASTDIYSLGVILYETLTEQLPYEFANLSLDEIRHLVCETSPSLPSEASFRSATLIAQTQTGTVATGNSTIPEGSKSRLRRKLRGDLDNIVLMAMRAEQGRRYATVDALIADLDAYTASMPISARPSSAGYRAQKWMGRNKRKVFLATAASAAIVFGIGWYVYAQIAKADAVLKAQIANADAEIAKKKLEISDAETAAEKNKLLQKDKEIFNRYNSLSKNDYAKNPEISLPIIEDFEKNLREHIKQKKNAAPAKQLEIKQNIIKVLAKKSNLFIINRNINEGLASTETQLNLARAIFNETNLVDDSNQLCIALTFRGDIYLKAKDFTAAKAFYDESFQIREAKSKENPTDISASRNFCKAFIRIRDLAKEQGQLDLALQYSTEMLTILTKLKNELKGVDPKKIQKAESEESGAVKDSRAKDPKEIEKEINKEIEDRKIKAEETRVKVEKEWLVAVQWHAEDLRNMDRLEEAEKELIQTLPVVKQRLKVTESADNHTLINIYEALMCEISLDRQDFKKALSAANRAMKAAEATIQYEPGSEALQLFVDAAGLKALVQADMGDAEDSLDTVQSAMQGAYRMRDQNKQLSGDAINDQHLLMMYAYEMRALILLGRMDEANDVGGKAMALASQRNNDAGARWFEPKSNVYSQAALMEKDSVEAIRLANIAVEEAAKANNPLIQLEAYETLVTVLRKFASQEDINVEIAKAIDISNKMKRPRVDAILKRIRGDTKSPVVTPPIAEPKIPATTSPVATPPTTAPKTPATIPPTTTPPKSVPKPPETKPENKEKPAPSHI